MPGVMLTIDPGEDSGWSCWDRKTHALLVAGTTRLWDLIDDIERGLLHNEGVFKDVDLVVCEDWALYEWEVRNLAWDKCRTARGIGAITLLCRQSGTVFRLQGAKIKNYAVAAGAEEYFYRPLKENRHQNDAIMHGVYYIQKVVLGNDDDRELTDEERDAIRPGEEHYDAAH